MHWARYRAWPQFPLIFFAEFFVYYQKSVGGTYLCGAHANIWLGWIFGFPIELLLCRIGKIVAVGGAHGDMRWMSPHSARAAIYSLGFLKKPKRGQLGLRESPILLTSTVKPISPLIFFAVDGEFFYSFPKNGVNFRFCYCLFPKNCTWRMCGMHAGISLGWIFGSRTEFLFLAGQEMLWRLAARMCSWSSVVPISMGVAGFVV